jgi:ribosome biogenesis GTPase
MPAVTDLSALGWTSDRDGRLPAGCVPARVTRVGRGRLSVVTTDGERRGAPAMR